LKPGKQYSENLLGDFLGGTSGMLVALPSTIAYGLICYAPLGPTYASWAVMGAILGLIPICFLAPLFGGIKVLISAPTAATAAIISVFVAELVKGGSVPPNDIPLMVTLLTMVSGLLQIIIGNFGGGKFIKYIPFPVITGYLSGLCVLILISQVPKVLGLPAKMNIATGLMHPDSWHWENIAISGCTIVFIVVARKFVKKVPSVIIGLVAGVASYWVIAAFEPSLRLLDNNPYVLGKISASPADLWYMATERWHSFTRFRFTNASELVFTGIEIVILLSITTLNSCLVIDTLTFSNHDPKKELMVQGLGNMAAGLFCGIPSAGSLTTSYENIKSGGKTSKSMIFAGIEFLAVLLFFSQLIQWLPLPSLAGILVMVAISLIDFKIFSLLKYKSTVFDFFVIISVVVAAAELDLIKAAGVGLSVAILLFLKEQMGASVVRRRLFGNQIFSKTLRLEEEMEILEVKGTQTVIIQLHGQLFFGTTDQLFTKLQPYFLDCKYFVLDLHRIQSVDYTAANMLKKILARIKDLNGFLILSSIPDVLSTGQKPGKYLENFGLFRDPHVKAFNDFDESLSWIEDRILAEDKIAASENKLIDLSELEFFKGFSDRFLETVYSCLEEKSYGAGEFVFRAGEQSDEIYFIRRGNIKIVLPLAEGKTFHLQTICKGGIFGEMAFIDNVTRSADAFSVDESILYILSREKFNQATATHPEVGGIFFERLALIIANRLRQANKELKVLHEN